MLFLHRELCVVARKQGSKQEEKESSPQARTASSKPKFGGNENLGQCGQFQTTNDASSFPFPDKNPPTKTSHSIGSIVEVTQYDESKIQI
jgi:hypothetical protein